MFAATLRSSLTTIRHEILSFRICCEVKFIGVQCREDSFNYLLITLKPLYKIKHSADFYVKRTILNCDFFKNFCHLFMGTFLFLFVT